MTLAYLHLSEKAHQEAADQTDTKEWREKKRGREIIIPDWLPSDIFEMKAIPRMTSLGSAPQNRK